MIPLILLAVGLVAGGGVWIATGGPGEPPVAAKVKPVVQAVKPVPPPEQVPEPESVGAVKAEPTVETATKPKVDGMGAARRDGDCTLLQVCDVPSGWRDGWNTRARTDGEYIYHDVVLAQGGEIAYQPTASGGWVVTVPPGGGITVAVIPVEAGAGGAIEFVTGWNSLWWEQNVKSLQIVAVQPPVCHGRARIGRDGEVVPVVFIEAVYQSRPAAKPTGSGQSVELI